MIIGGRTGTVIVVAMLLNRNGLYAAVPNHGLSRGILTLPGTEVKPGESIWTACERYLDAAGITATGLVPSGFHVDRVAPHSGSVEGGAGDYVVTLAFTPTGWELTRYEDFFWVVRGKGDDGES